MLSREEIKLGLEFHLGVDITPSMVDNILNLADYESDSINFENFLIGILSTDIANLTDKIKKTFRIMDINCNGSISMLELRQFLPQNIGFSEIESIFKEMGFQNSICYDNFFDFMINN